MPHRPSSITRLEPRIREEVDRAVREGRATIDEIVALIRAHGGEASRAAVGRFVKNARDQMELRSKARDVARVWVEKFGEEPDGDIGRLLIEMLRMLSFQTLSQIGEAKEGANPMEVMLLAKAMDHMAKASKSGVERELKVDELVKKRATQAADAIARMGKKGGWSAATIEKAKRAIMGIAA